MSQQYFELLPHYSAAHIRNMRRLSSSRNLLMAVAVVRIAKEPFHARERLQNKPWTEQIG